MVLGLVMLTVVVEIVLRLWAAEPSLSCHSMVRVRLAPELVGFAAVDTNVIEASTCW
jgi:hypothetical protein